ncbi:DUF2834 domain-containing protein [Laspinema sp. D1]|uniref:DUF2834 domain-containing protein n=1 Tax=Laspinema palackyanum TaxID=3231601 RepID=UPI00347BC981|nr:DUF2834 domain-containing protein [Laspinema sp. D2b]
MMVLKIVLLIIWAFFVGYILQLQPLEQSGNLTLIEKMVKLQLNEVNAYAFTLFSFMGVWPLVYACLMFIDERMQPIPAWPSFLASNGSGVIGMMPYLLLRESRPYFAGPKDWIIKLFDARLTGISLLLSTIGLIIYALSSGNFDEFIKQWQTSRFLYLMSLDFALLYLVFPTLLGDDMARRGWHDSRIFWAVAIVPLLGPLVYLSIRPPLPETE